MLLESLINGLSLGCIYALVALGFVIVFKATNVINFSHTAVLALGAFVIAKWHEDLGFWPSVAVAAVLCAVVASLIDVVLIRPLRKRRGGEESLAILTLGVYILLATELQRQIGSDTLDTGAPGGSNTTEILGTTIAENRLIAAGLAVVLIAALFAVFRFTDLGIAMRSTAADSPTAALMGIRLSRVALISWALAGALAAIAGAFFAAFPSPPVTNRTSFVALATIPAAVAGGLDSLLGAVVGGLLIGIAVSFIAGYQDDLAFLGRGLSEVGAYFVMFVILLWRPSGIFGSREVSRV